MYCGLTSFGTCRRLGLTLYTQIKDPFSLRLKPWHPPSSRLILTMLPFKGQLASFTSRVDNSLSTGLRWGPICSKIKNLESPPRALSVSRGNLCVNLCVSVANLHNPTCRLAPIVFNIPARQPYGNLTVQGRLLEQTSQTTDFIRTDCLPPHSVSFTRR